MFIPHTLGLTPQFSKICLFLLLTFASAGAQTPAVPTALATSDMTGMYSFLEEGEFVQVTIENSAHNGPKSVTGFVSRFGDLESDKGAFLDQFFTKGSLNGSKLTFTTKQVHSVWFDFSGTIARGPAKARAEEGYYVIRGTLRRHATDAKKKTSTQERTVVFKSFPDLDTDSEIKAAKSDM